MLFSANITVEEGVIVAAINDCIFYIYTLLNTRWIEAV